MKRKELLIILALHLYIFTPLHLYSLDLGFARQDGGRPGAFLSYGAGARSLALGKTFVGIADDASTIYWNPAGLATLQKPELTALYASLYEQTGYSFAAGVVPLKPATSDQRPGTVGFALVNLSSRGFQLRDEYNYELGEGGVSESAAILSYGTKLPLAVGGSRPASVGGQARLAVGANLKLVNQNVNAQSDTGYGVDIGFLWQPDSSSLPANVGGQAQSAVSGLGKYLNPLSVGLNIQNIIAPKLALIEDPDKYPLAATLGFSYRFCNNNLLTAIDLNKTGNRQVKLHIGAEYTFVKMLALRAGIDETEVTTGLGFKWQNYSLDYAFAYHDAWKGYEDLGISHRFGLTMRWGDTRQPVNSSNREKQVTANSSELVESTKKQELQTTNYELLSPNSSSDFSPDSEPLTVEAAATPPAPVDAPGTGLTEERLKQKIKEQIEKETGEEVSNVEIEKIEEVGSEKITGSSELADSNMIKDQPQTTSSKPLIYKVKPGDCLWDIAGKKEIYNNPWNWILIYEANKEQIKNPDLIHPGQALKITLKHFGLTIKFGK